MPLWWNSGGPSWPVALGLVMWPTVKIEQQQSLAGTTYYSDPDPTFGPWRKPTGIYLPPGVDTDEGVVDILLYLHGHLVSSPKQLFEGDVWLSLQGARIGHLLAAETDAIHDHEVILVQGVGSHGLEVGSVDHADARVSEVVLEPIGAHERPGRCA